MGTSRGPGAVGSEELASVDYTSALGVTATAVSAWRPGRCATAQAGSRCATATTRTTQ
jgi:hypothetical protein